METPCALEVLGNFSSEFAIKTDDSSVSVSEINPETPKENPFYAPSEKLIMCSTRGSFPAFE